MASNPNYTGGVSAPSDQLLNVWNLNGYVFDAFLRMQHDSGLVITQHPVQTGAAITDHSYVNPKKFTFEVGVTDCARPIIVPNGKVIRANPTRYQAAYNVLVNMQENRNLLYLVSKYGFFENILIENISIPDDSTTQGAIKATVTLTEVILANARTITVSDLPETTDGTERGQVTGKPVIQSTLGYLRYGPTPNEGPNGQ